MTTRLRTYLSPYFFLYTRAEGGIKYDDKKIGINWKLPVTEVSERDNNHSYLNDSFTG
jgi:dTDP-4-dehydrorhamnose 3,5-epimerase